MVRQDMCQAPAVDRHAVRRQGTRSESSTAVTEASYAGSVQGRTRGYNESRAAVVCDSASEAVEAKCSFSPPPTPACRAARSVAVQQTCGERTNHRNSAVLRRDPPACRARALSCRGAAASARAHARSGAAKTHASRHEPAVRRACECQTSSVRRRTVLAAGTQRLNACGASSVHVRNAQANQNSARWYI